jgi:hypothetical protein
MMKGEHCVVLLEIEAARGVTIFLYISAVGRGIESVSKFLPALPSAPGLLSATAGRSVF